MTRNVTDEGYSRNVTDEGYSRNVTDEGYSRNVTDEGYSRNVTHEYNTDPSFHCLVVQNKNNKLKLEAVSCSRNFPALYVDRIKGKEQIYCFYTFLGK
jgi:hypothetical protein